MPVKLERGAPRYRVKHFTTEPLRSLVNCNKGPDKQNLGVKLWIFSYSSVNESNLSKGAVAWW